MSSFLGKVIAISRGASGIGLATAKLLTSQGAKVSISDIDEKALEEYIVAEAFKSSTGDIVPLNRIGKPQEVASLIAFLLSDDAAFITGTVQVIDGGVAA